MGSNCFFVCQLWDAVNFFPKALGLWKPGEKKLDDFLLFFISLWGIFKFKTISLKTKITIENSSISAVALIGISSDHYWRVSVYCSNRMGKFQLLGFLQGKIFLGKKKKKNRKKKNIYIYSSNKRPKCSSKKVGPVNQKSLWFVEFLGELGRKAESS